MTISDHHPSHIILGLWPIAGITTVGVTRREARETIAKAIDCGITSFDTAYSYGFEGESDRLLSEFLGKDRDRFRVIGKVGQRWDENRNRVVDGSPATLVRDAETSLKRIGIDSFDVLLLHSPDPRVPLAQSAQTMAQLQRRGLCRSVGISNVTVDQYLAFAQMLRTLESQCSAIQCPLNLLQRDSLRELIPTCAKDDCFVYVFWTLMKGLLAGRIGRDHVFAEGDSRPGYAIFQGSARQRAHDVLDAMRTISQSTGMTLAQLSIGWAISQRGVRGVLVGARRASQVAEIANAKMLPEDVVSRIDQIVASTFASDP
jgi:aryl-alcohol dehydrogenase-like predicted oxidoreductase